MNDDFVPDISAFDLQNRISVENPKNYNSLVSLKKQTIARICIGRSGGRFKTETYLRLRADHAIAIDTIWSDVDEAIINKLGFYKVQTLVRSKEEYLTNPNLGRRFSEATIAQIRKNCIHNPDMQIIAADGLSAYAINDNLRDVYSIIIDGFRDFGYSVGTPIFVKYGRVAAMDKISEALGAKVTVLLVGERPGLAVGDSMGCYMAYEASSKKPESQRTVISNIHKKGTPPVEAGAQIVETADLIMRMKKSGVDLKI